MLFRKRNFGDVVLPISCLSLCGRVALFRAECQLDGLVECTPESSWHQDSDRLRQIVHGQLRSVLQLVFSRLCSPNAFRRTVQEHTSKACSLYRWLHPSHALISSGIASSAYWYHIPVGTRVGMLLWAMSRVVLMLMLMPGFFALHQIMDVLSGW